MKTITIQVPDGCEIQIVRKEEKKGPVIRTYQDLIDNGIEIKGFWINGFEINSFKGHLEGYYCEDIAASEKVAKSMLAMAKISQLMPYYGGEITDEEWKNEDITKYVIVKRGTAIGTDSFYILYSFLAFHTAEQRDNFLKYNEQLVKDYLMILRALIGCGLAEGNSTFSLFMDNKIRWWKCCKSRQTQWVTDHIKK